MTEPFNAYAEAADDASFSRTMKFMCDCLDGYGRYKGSGISDEETGS